MAVSATEVVTQDVPPMDGEGNRTVIIAIVANIGVGIAKIIAGVMTGSSAMLAEAFHSIADTGNEALLLVAQWRGRVPPDEEHPLGHGREAYFWALLASLGVFLTGAGLSFRQGINELRNPTEADHFLIAYAVLVISFFLEGFSLLRAYRQIKQEAGQHHGGHECDQQCQLAGHELILDRRRDQQANAQRDEHVQNRGSQQYRQRAPQWHME